MVDLVINQYSYTSRLLILCVWHGYIVAQVNHSGLIQYFKLIILEIQNVPLRTVFANPVTYIYIYISTYVATYVYLRTCVSDLHL